MIHDTARFVIRTDANKLPLPFRNNVYNTPGRVFYHHPRDAFNPSKARAFLYSVFLFFFFFFSFRVGYKYGNSRAHIFGSSSCSVFSLPNAREREREREREKETRCASFRGKRRPALSPLKVYIPKRLRVFAYRGRASRRINSANLCFIVGRDRIPTLVTTARRFELSYRLVSRRPYEMMPMIEFTTFRSFTSYARLWRSEDGKYSVQQTAK